MMGNTRFHDTGGLLIQFQDWNLSKIEGLFTLESGNVLGQTSSRIECYFPHWHKLGGRPSCARVHNTLSSHLLKQCQSTCQEARQHW